MGGSARGPWIFWGLLVAIGLGLLVWFLAPRPGRVVDQGVPPQEIAKVQRLDRNASLRLIELRNIGLGHLENHRFDDATKAFDEILSALPNEPFAVRNRAIGLVKRAAEAIDERAEPEQFAAAMKAAQAAIDQWESIQPDSALAAFLRAVLATKTSEPADVAAHLREALRRDPKHAPWWFQWFELGRSLRSQADKDLAFAAGDRAAEIAADNMFVQKEFLAEVLSRQAERARQSPEDAAQQSDDILARLERLREPLRVLGLSVQLQAKIDVVRILDDVLAAGREGNWQKARNEFFKIKNLLSQETAADADLIHPHPLTYHDPLNYVATDFGPEFSAQADLPDATLPKIDVSWVDTKTSLPDTMSPVAAFAWWDVDLDGMEDLIVLNSNGVSVFTMMANQQGWGAYAVSTEGSFSGILVGDLDDDVVPRLAESTVDAGPASPERCHEADPDFVLYGLAGVRLVNTVRGDDQRLRRLDVVDAASAGFEGLADVSQARLVDFDHDGDLDLVTLAKSKLQLWVNRGNFTFLEATTQSLVPPDDFLVTSFAAVDWDEDNDVDLLVSGEERSGWMENLRHGRMRFHALDGLWSNARQMHVAEIDGDGNWDIVAAGPEGARVLFTERPPSGPRRVRREVPLTTDAVKSLQLVDFDNDGGLDLAMDHTALWRNNGAGAFERQPSFSAAAGNALSASVFADVDRDGDLDFIGSPSDGKLRFVANQGGNRNHQLQVRFRAQQVKQNEQGASKRVNHYGIGNTVEVKVGTRYQAQIADGQTIRFGLGPAEKADIVRVLMTNGVPQNRIEPRANELICERQVLLTSCPYLFVWNGSRYEFVTDLLWASPLGLKASQTELVPWRAWEYLKIDGAKLQPIDGEYRLQITEELWEAAYFDQVKLLAVDHPADVQVFTNEKVGSSVLASHKIHTVRQPCRPKGVRDQAGRDWSSQLAERDEVYARTFDRKHAQGLCAEHYLEFDLGELDAPRDIKLFLTGWVRPTDTNINVALDQNPELPSPGGLALWTPDSHGAWREISPHVGFPNGKTKTIVLDLSGALTPGDYRFRLVTNREFYWDHAFFTVDDPPADFRQFELPMVRADLHERGVSRGVLPAGDGPETYDYDQLAAIPPWPAIDGFLTRYGDVLPLLTERDDRLAVLGVGDELSLAFQVPADPPPDGWTRDFVLYNVGWVKDCLLNTWEGQRVEPLPFADMNGHDYWTGRPDETGAYGDYLRRYQTRRQQSGFRDYVLRFTPEQKQTLPVWERTRRNGD